MSISIAKYFYMSFDTVAVTKGAALKSHFLSVRLIKTIPVLTPVTDSYVSSILLGKAIDYANRLIYAFYHDTNTHYSWIIEFRIDDRAHQVVYFDPENNIGFSEKYKIRNPRVVDGRIIWTDDNMPIYQMDAKRAKNSYFYKIGYSTYPTVEWDGATVYDPTQIVSFGKYYYKALLASQNISPNSNTNFWRELCLIEDAYYSMDPANFYFAAIPPKNPPTVNYVSDDTRRINNLKQTLFQIAYRYVYIDWRRSTFSPASIVTLPQAEEETLTGLANEQISLNNSLRIFVNTGGEEVRAVEIVARSSEDPTKWFLIETIEKFTEEERGGEVSVVDLTAAKKIKISVPEATVVNTNIVNSDTPPGNLMRVKDATVIPSWLIIADINLVFDSEVEDATGKQVSDLTWAPAGSVSAIIANTCVQNGVTWCVVMDDTLASIPVNGAINIGTTKLHFYPNSKNTGALRSGIIRVRGLYGDIDEIRITQNTPVIPPLGSLQVSPDDLSGLTITDQSATPTVGSPLVTLAMTPDHPDWYIGYRFVMYWKAVKAGRPVGTGSFYITNQILSTLVEPIIIVLNETSYNGEVIMIYVSADNMQEISVTASQRRMPMSVLFAEVKNSVCSVSPPNLGFSYLAGDPSYKQAITVSTGDAVQTRVTSAPAWLNVVDAGGYDLTGGHYIEPGEVIYAYPKNANPSTTSLGPANIVFANEFGDTTSVAVTQSGAPSTLVAPIRIPTTTYSYPTDETVDGFWVYGGGTYNTGSKDIALSFTADHPSLDAGVPFAAFWVIMVNGVKVTAGDWNGVDDYLIDSMLNSKTIYNLNNFAPGDVVRVFISNVYIGL